MSDKPAPSSSAPKTSALNMASRIFGALGTQAAAQRNPSPATASFAKAMPHLAAMTQGKGMLSTMLSGFKAAHALTGVTREMSKMMKSGMTASGGLGGVGKPGGGMKMVMGKPEKNWEKATTENGFREIGKVGSKATGGFRIMMGKPEKNWEKAKNPDNGFRQIGGSHGLSIMAKIEKNWERPEFGHSTQRKGAPGEGFQSLQNHVSGPARQRPKLPALKSNDKEN